MVGLKRKPPSEESVRFAEAVVDRAGILDEAIADSLVAAFAAVPRERFLPPEIADRAHEDVALPIGYGRSVARPSLLARLIGLIGPARGMRILELGCGCGYASALMTSMGAQVYGIEPVGLLAQKTRHLLDSLHFENVLVRRAEMREQGWSEHGPYDAVIATTHVGRVEPELIAQLVNPGGRMVVPVGDKHEQTLGFWEAKASGVMLYQLEACKIAEGVE